MKDVTSLGLCAAHQEDGTVLALADAVSKVLESSLSGTAKLKMKLKRLHEMLSVDISGTKGDGEYANAAVSGIKNNILPLEQEPATEQEPEPTEPGNFPYVVFVGQLSYSTTRDEIENHFRTTGGVSGPVTVRLLTSASTSEEAGTTQRSKGMAFVEIEGARELRNALSLHHSVLNERAINVELSAGGGKKKRSLAIETKRSDRTSARPKFMHAPPPIVKGLVPVRVPVPAAAASEVHLSMQEQEQDGGTASFERYSSSALSDRGSSSSRGGRGNSSMRGGRGGRSVEGRLSYSISSRSTATADMGVSQSDQIEVPSLENIFRSAGTRGRGRGRM